MTTRTTEQTVSFQQPFALKGSERMYPAGAYRIVTDEEPIEGLSFLAYRRVSTMMFVPAARGNGSIEMLLIPSNSRRRVCVRWPEASGTFQPNPSG